MPTRHEIDVLIDRVRAWPDLAKFEVFDALREDLAGALSSEHPENLLIQERRDALAYIEKAAKHLHPGRAQACRRRAPALLYEHE